MWRGSPECLSRNSSFRLRKSLIPVRRIVVARTEGSGIAKLRSLRNSPRSLVCLVQMTAQGWEGNKCPKVFGPRRLCRRGRDRRQADRRRQHRTVDGSRRDRTGPLGANLVVTGLEQYRRLYGGQSCSCDKDGMRPSNSSMGYAAEGFFNNGGKPVYVARVVGDKANAAKLELIGTAPTAGPPPPPPPPPPEGGATVTPPGERNHEDQRKVGPRLRVVAIGPGDAGSRIWVQISNSSLGDRSPGAIPLLCRVYRDANGREALREEFDDLSPRHDAPNYFERRVNGASSLIRLERPDGLPGPARPDNSPNLPPPKEKELTWVALKDGRDGDAPVLLDYQGRSDSLVNATGSAPWARSTRSRSSARPTIRPPPWSGW